jgi:hypothetical protein
LSTKQKPDSLCYLLAQYNAANLWDLLTIIHRSLAMPDRLDIVACSTIGGLGAICASHKAGLLAGQRLLIVSTKLGGHVLHMAFTKIRIALPSIVDECSGEGGAVAVFNFKTTVSVYSTPRCSSGGYYTCHLPNIIVGPAARLVDLLDSSYCSILRVLSSVRYEE